MGVGHSRGPPPRIPISIPNFPYPPDIFSYLMSQSTGYIITFTTPDGKSGNVTMPPDQPKPADTSTFSTAAPTVPSVTTRPAYSTGLTTPPITTPPINPLPTPPYVPPGIPPMWVAAIWAMAFVNDIGPIKDYDTLQLFYSSVATKITEIMKDGTHQGDNVGALVYFCTVTTILFQPFMTNFTYNYLNVTFPKVFSDTSTTTGASIYNKFVMVNYYAKHMGDILKPNGYPGSGYIPVTENRVMVYAVPNMLNSVIILLTDQSPLTEV